MKLWVPPYLSIRQLPNGVRLGTLPPLAWEATEAPAFLIPLLARLTAATERSTAVQVTQEMSGWTTDEADLLVSDLEEARVLVPARESGDRFDRHRLFYQMVGIDGDAQETLASKTVGLIGMGGIGTHLATHLVAAGIGRLIVTDGDNIELSNLTRQTLFTESDVDRPKVDVAAERLRALRSDVQVDIIRQAFTDPSLAVRVAAGSDLVVLSADRPADVHLWAGRACRDAGIPMSSAGYIEGHGCVGPLLDAPHTPCIECVRLSAAALPEQDADAASVAMAAHEHHPRWQAPSFGPLNALVAAIQANEVIRRLLGLPSATAGRRLLIDSRSYDVTWEDFRSETACPTCGQAATTPVWDSIAEMYATERDEHSFNAALLDGLAAQLATPGPGRRIADVGAGAGQVTTSLALGGARVDAYEPTDAMRRLLAQRTTGLPGVTVIDGGIDALNQRSGSYDAVCCLNVLDHVTALPEAVATLVNALKPGGTLVVSLPHPMKDRGGWKKTRSGDDWTYEHFITDDYFDEGTCHKARARIASGPFGYRRSKPSIAPSPTTSMLCSPPACV